MHETELSAVLSIAKNMMELTAHDGFERCALVCHRKNGWTVTRTLRGLHSNVIFPALFLALYSLFTREAALVHTHPHCTCHNGEAFSGCRNERGRIAVMGDVCVPSLGRIRRIWLISPAGTVSVWDGKSAPQTITCLAPAFPRVKFSSTLHGLWPKHPRSA